MNKKQYNNIIDHTLKHEHTEDSLSTARAIFNNMGVALPNGDMKEVYETVKTDNYMGWKSCTMQEAQSAADNGTAAIGISEDRIVVLAGTDEEEPVAQTASVMTFDENTSAFAVNGLEYYSYSYGTTTDNGSDEPLVLDKPYDSTYPYQNNFANSQIYYNYLNTYSYELRNDVVYEFNFEEFNRFRAHLSLLHYERSSQQEARQVLEDIIDLVSDAASYIPKVGIIFGLLNTASTISSLGNNSVQDDIRDIKDCVDAFSYYMASNNKVYKKSNSVTYKVSLLMKSPQNGREIKIESSDGNKDIYTLQNASYESAQLAASIYAHNITIYKVAPGYTYYYE